MMTASGELDNSEKTARQIRHLLLDTRGVLDSSGRSTEAFKKLTLNFKAYQFSITIVNNLILAVKLTTI